MAVSRTIQWLAAATILYVAACTARAVLVYGPASVGTPAEVSTTVLVLAPALILGWLVGIRVPSSPVGPALAWTGAVPALVLAFEDWGATYFTDAPLPGSRSAAVIGAGVWAWLFLGFARLVLVFPDGLLPGRLWRLVAIAAPCTALLVNFVIATDTSNFSKQPGDGSVTGRPPFVLPGPARIALICLAFGSSSSC